MVYREEIALLEQEKQWLVSRGDLQRVMLALELRHVRSRTHVLARLLAWRGKSRILLLPGVGLAGFLLTRRRVRSWLMKALVGWTLWRRTRALRTVLRWLPWRR